MAPIITPESPTRRHRKESRESLTRKVEDWLNSCNDFRGGVGMPLHEMHPEEWPAAGSKYGSKSRQPSFQVGKSKSHHRTLPSQGYSPGGAINKVDQASQRDPVSCFTNRLIFSTKISHKYIREDIGTQEGTLLWDMQQTILNSVFLHLY